MTKLILEFTTTNGVESLEYQLSNNVIAQKWANKISQLQHIPVDRATTSDSMMLLSYHEYKTKLDSIIDWINIHTHLSLSKKELYTQDDLCVFHDHFLDLMKNPKYDWQPQVYDFNTTIHYCENALHQRQMGFFRISWGGNDGPVMEKFQQSPYQYYTENIVAGNLYLYWAEQGKTPAEYYYSHDPDNLENFLKVTTPHQQFSGYCTLQLGSRPLAGQDFWKWFEQYKQPFLNHWGLDNWTALHQNGAIELATLINSQDQFEMLKKNFKKFERIYITNG